jgi:hypothetical protein
MIVRSRKESTVNSFITMLNGLIEEGVSPMSAYATPGLVTFKKPTKCGLITAITIDEFKDHRPHDVDRVLHLMNWVNFDEDEISQGRTQK